MFGGEASDKKVKVLSGGERSRLAMIRLLLEPVNLLILDEPTNHLDMRSKDVLKEAIKTFDGTVIVVSHDREFLDGLVTKVYEFGHKKIKEHLGGIYDFLQSKKIENLQELERKTIAAAVKEPAAKPVTDSKLDYEARKELSRQIKKLERQQQEAEAAIDRLEKEIALLEISMNDNPTPEIFTDYEKLKQQLADEMEKWENVLMEREELEQ
jgi:ATP-binding cassette subfamily F protein 3